MAEGQVHPEARKGVPEPGAEPGKPLLSADLARGKWVRFAESGSGRGRVGVMGGAAVGGELLRGGGDGGS